MSDIKTAKDLEIKLNSFPVSQEKYIHSKHYIIYEYEFSEMYLMFKLMSLVYFLEENGIIVYNEKGWNGKYKFRWLVVDPEETLMDRSDTLIESRTQSLVEAVLVGLGLLEKKLEKQLITNIGE